MRSWLGKVEPANIEVEPANTVEPADNRADLWGYLTELARPWVTRRAESDTFRGITTGTLDDAVMRRWIEQDYLYLYTYARVLARLASMAPDAHVGPIVDAAHHTMHRELDQIIDLGRLFDADLGGASPSGAGAAYAAHLVASAETYETGVVSVLPCMVGFAAIGLTLDRPEEPRYRRWIETYAAGDFQSVTQRFGTIVNELDIAPAAAAEVFETGMRYEMELWEDAEPSA